MPIPSSSVPAVQRHCTSSALHTVHKPPLVVDIQWSLSVDPSRLRRDVPYVGNIFIFSFIHVHVHVRRRARSLCEEISIAARRLDRTELQLCAALQACRIGKMVFEAPAARNPPAMTADFRKMTMRTPPNLPEKVLKDPCLRCGAPAYFPSSLVCQAMPFESSPRGPCKSSRPHALRTLRLVLSILATVAAGAVLWAARAEAGGTSSTRHSPAQACVEQSLLPTSGGGVGVSVCVSQFGDMSVSCGRACRRSEAPLILGQQGKGGQQGERSAQHEHTRKSPSTPETRACGCGPWAALPARAGGSGGSLWPARALRIRTLTHTGRGGERAGRRAQRARFPHPRSKRARRSFELPSLSPSCLPGLGLVPSPSYTPLSGAGGCPPSTGHTREPCQCNAAADPQSADCENA